MHRRRGMSPAREEPLGMGHHSIKSCVSGLDDTWIPIFHGNDKQSSIGDDIRYPWIPVPRSESGTCFTGMTVKPHTAGPRKDFVIPAEAGIQTAWQPYTELINA